MEMERLEGIRPGNVEDFERLYVATYPKMLNVVRDILRDNEAAEDCVQDAYLQAFRAWPRWRPDAPAEAWLIRIAKNTAVSHIRRRSIRTADEYVRRVGDPTYVSEDPTAFVDHDDLRSALEKLPKSQREAMVLRYVHGYSNRAIARRDGTPERTIGSRLSAGRARMRAELEPVA